MKSQTKRRIGVRAISLTLVVLFGPVWALGQESGQPGNTMCPVLTDEPIDPEVYTDYQGRRVYLCCRRCLAMFEKDPEKYAVNLPALAASHDDGHDHDHTGEASHQTAGGDPTAPKTRGFFQWVGRFHPATVHFPIGLLVAAAIAEMLLIVTGKAFFVPAGRFCVWVGAIGAAVAAMLGWFLAGFHLTDGPWILATHRWLGTSTAAWAILLLFLTELRHRTGGTKWLGRYRPALFIGAALAAATGFFGGALVHGIDHYAW